LGGLYIVFPTTETAVGPPAVFANYNWNGQIVIVGFNAIAQSAAYVDVPAVVGPPAVAASITVTLTSEIFSGPGQTFIGSLIPIGVDLTPFNNFVAYSGFPSQQTIALGYINELVGDPSCRSISATDFNSMGYIASMFSLRCNLTKRCCKTKRCKTTPTKKTQKSDTLKYLAFVCCSLRCLPKLESCPKYVCELSEACRSSECSVDVFIALLLKLCISLKLEGSHCIQSLFDSVVRYNPFCSPAACPESLYRLSAKDCALVSRSCICAEVCADVEVMAIEEIEESSSSCSSDEEMRDRKKDEKKKPFASRYKWHITVTVAVVVIASASAYAFVM